MEIEKLGDKEISILQLCYIEAVLMPNGEIISSGKSIGFLGTNTKSIKKEFIYIKKEDYV